MALRQILILFWLVNSFCHFDHGLKSIIICCCNRFPLVFRHQARIIYENLNLIAIFFSVDSSPPESLLSKPPNLIDKIFPIFLFMT